jgi:hypothetical protein
MAKADRVLSTPPTNTSATTPKSSRRSFLVQAAGVTAGGAAIGAGLPLPAPSVAAQPLDADLIELGARFEPLVDQYYAARERWALSLMAAHAERDKKYGELAHEELLGCCERSGEPAASAALSKVQEEMEPLIKAINAAPVTSIEGLRVKALVAFREVAPLCASDLEFSFEDEYPFQQLFTAVAELCGLKEKIAATGYALPDIDSPDDDTDDEGEEA